MTAPESDETRRYLFLCGVARSGTTAAVELLNVHRKIALGIERYKHIYLQPDAELSSALFEKERFFDYRPTDSNIRLDRGFARAYRRLEAKFDRVRYTGDKVPNLYRAFDRISAAIPAARFLYLVRDPVRTASSWHVRATDPQLRWKPSNDYRRAIVEWNEANRLALAFRQSRPDRILAIRYEELFSGDSRTLCAVLDWLGLARSEKVLEYHRTRCVPKASVVSDKGTLLTPEQRDEIAQSARRDVAEELVAMR